jgi:hypothetical protein
MSAELKLVIRKTAVSVDTICPFCGTTFERFVTAAMLYDGVHSRFATSIHPHR